MKHWIRVALISSVLVGGTVFFAYHSLNQLDNALDTMSASYVAIANMRSIALADKTNGDQISTTTPDITSASTTSTDLNLSFIFPKKDDELYSGCTYQISLHASTTMQEASTTIHALETALIDVSTGESVGPIASGLARENTINADSQDLKWKVGVVWPGEYRIALSKIDTVDTKNESDVFTINKMPEGIGIKEQKNICKKSGGLL